MPRGREKPAWAALSPAQRGRIALSTLLDALSEPDRKAVAMAELDRRVLHPVGPDQDPATLVLPLLEYASGEERVLDLVAALAQEGLSPARRDALRAGVPLLLELAGDSQPRIRTAASAVLGELAWCADEIIPELLGRFTVEAKPGVRSALVLAVGRLVAGAPRTIHRRRAMTWLRRRRTADDAGVRLVATAMAWRIGRVRRADLPALLGALPAADPAMLDGVAAVTGGVSDWLADELGDDRDARVEVAARLFDVPAGAGVAALRAAAGVIARWRSAAAVLLPAVAVRLSHSDPEVRGSAAHILAAAGPAASAHADALGKALADPAARVADLAAWGLSRMGDPRGLPRLRNRALMGTSIFDVVQAYHPRGTYLFSAPGLLDVLAPLGPWAGKLLARIRSALSDADGYYQRRVLAEVLGRWGARAAPAVPELSALLDTDAARRACGALGAIGPGARSAAGRLVELVERGESSRLRLAAAWAHWRVSGEPDFALPVLGDALRGELGASTLPLLADLGPLAAVHANRVRALGLADNDWIRTEAARALWRLTGDPAESWVLLTAVLAPLAQGDATPVTRRALMLAGELPGPPPQAVSAVVRRVVRSDRRYTCYGDWRAIVDDAELADLAAAALTTGPPAEPTGPPSQPTGPPARRR
jgi:hypothetical protein